MSLSRLRKRLQLRKLQLTLNNQKNKRGEHLSPQYAGMMELADVLDSKSSGSDTVRVRPPLPAPKHPNPNLLPIGETFGFVVFLIV